MAWPSGTKASTDNVDEGTDFIAYARADIKQNFDNVNDIIDEFNISSPNNGDLLQYSTSTGKWEQVAASSVGSSVQIAVVTLTTSAEENVTGNEYRRSFTVDADPNTMIGIDSAGDFTFELANGTYIFQPDNSIDAEGTPLKIHNDSDDSEESNFPFTEIGTTDDRLIQGTGVITVTSGPKAFSFRQTASNLQQRDATATFVVTKIA